MKKFFALIAVICLSAAAASAQNGYGVISNFVPQISEN